MRLLMNFTRAYPWRSSVMAACLLLSGIFEGLGLSVLLPLLTLAFPQGDGEGDGLYVSKNTKLQKVVSNAFNSLGLSPSIEQMLLIVFICILFKSVISLAAKKQVGYTVARVGTDLRKTIVRSLLCARWEQYIKRPLGEIANAMAFEADQSSKAYHCGILMVAEFIQFVVYTVTASLISWKATFLSILVGISTIIALHCFIRRARWAGVQQTDVSKSLLSLMTDIILSIKPLKAMAREDLADFMFDKNLQDLNKAQKKRVFNKEMLKAFQEPLLFIFLGFGIYMTLVVWRIPISQMMMLVFLIANLLKQLSKVQERYQETVTYESSYWSIRELVNSIEQSRETSVGKLVLPKLSKGVTFKDVSFRYGESIVLNKLSMHIGPGKITIIVGPSGAGKSTIMDLLTGLVQPMEGEVLIDDLPLSSLNLRSWRRMIGYVPQETILLHDTIYNNISLGNSRLDESNIIASLEKAGAWDFVQELPGMLNFVVGERGGGLSGGQRQRISIARALVNQPEILLLDEATSALDPVSEITICNTLIKLRGMLTIMMISHQPALLNIADHAYLIKDFSAEPIQPNMLSSHPLAAMNTFVT